jgi:hypothetical protein
MSLRISTISMILTAGLLLVGCSDDTNGATCGGKTCTSSERCCGPPSCGSCVPKDSKISCPSSCPDAATDLKTTPGDGPKGQPCGSTTCGSGSFCCGPQACGFCAPDNSGVYCPPTCPDASPG